MALYTYQGLLNILGPCENHNDNMPEPCKYSRAFTPRKYSRALHTKKKIQQYKLFSFLYVGPTYSPGIKVVYQVSCKNLARTLHTPQQFFVIRPISENCQPYVSSSLIAFQQSRAL